MSEVHAVKDPETIRLISHLLTIRTGKQMADVWNVGINLTLRISDLLSIKFSDIQGERLILRESKTGKVANIQLNAKAQILINDIKLRHPDHIYLFQSYRSKQTKYGKPHPLSRRAVCEAFRQVGQELNVYLGTHSMRKTRGYMLYQKTKDIGRVMKMLRHTSESATLRYIGITQDEVDHDFLESEL